MKVLPISHARTLGEWFGEREKIDMDPSYQRRGDLWPDRHRRLLINSVLNQYDVPKIYLADFTYGKSGLNENRKPYAVIDGKQRLMIFFQFLDNRLELDDTPVNLDGKTLNLKGFRFRDLQRQYSTLARKFEGFTPTVMSVITEDFEEIQELFVRLNLNVSISGAERRNAMAGPIPPIIRQLSVHEFFRSYATFPNNRGQDLNVAVKVLFMEHERGFTNTKKRDLDKFVEQNQHRNPEEFAKQRNAANKTLNLMKEVFSHNDLLLKGQAQLPVYYWLVRTRGSAYGGLIRSFLVEFEKQRSHARRVANDRAYGRTDEEADATLLTYNAAIRTPDDKRKQEFMFKVLDERLLEFAPS